jgi:HEPN domain-containing protein
MTAGVIHLHKRFFQAAEIDLKSARILKNANHFQPALYHFQQAYEKYVKSYYSLKETVDKNAPELKIYEKLRKLGHDTQKSTVKLLHEIADIQILWATKRIVIIRNIQAGNQPLNTIDPNDLPYYQQLVSEARGFQTKLDNLVARLNLQANYIQNVENYARTVRRQYNTFQNSNIELIAKQPEQTLLQVINTMANLYPCFYKMEQTTRYPLSEFSYENLDLLADQRQACNQIAEMLGDLVSILKPYLTKYQPNTNP